MTHVPYEWTKDGLEQICARPGCNRPRKDHYPRADWQCPALHSSFQTKEEARADLDKALETIGLRAVSLLTNISLEDAEAAIEKAESERDAAIARAEAEKVRAEAEKVRADTADGWLAYHRDLAAKWRPVVEAARVFVYAGTDRDVLLARLEAALRTLDATAEAKPMDTARCPSCGDAHKLSWGYDHPPPVEHPSPFAEPEPEAIDDSNCNAGPFGPRAFTAAICDLFFPDDEYGGDDYSDRLAQLRTWKLGHDNCGVEHAEEYAAASGERNRLRAKCSRQRKELRRLNAARRADSNAAFRRWTEENQLVEHQCTVIRHVNEHASSLEARIASDAETIAGLRKQLLVMELRAKSAEAIAGLKGTGE